MSRTRVLHHFKFAGSLVMIDHNEPTVARVQFYVDDDQRGRFEAYDFSMTRDDLLRLQKQIAAELRTVPLPSGKPKASP